MSSARAAGRLEVLYTRPGAPSDAPPLLFVHGLGHGAWCWDKWMSAAAQAGVESYAVSLRGHADSSGPLRTARLSSYVTDVVEVAESLPTAPVLVGHSMGGLVVQRTLARYRPAGAVLVASVGHRPAVGSLVKIGRQHPLDLARILVGMTLPMRREYLFENLSDAEAQPYLARCGAESPLAQTQLILHRPAAVPAQPVPVLVLGARDDRLVPIADVRATAVKYRATMAEFSGIGHNLMLDRGWEEPLEHLLTWLRSPAIAPAQRAAS